MGQGHVVSSFKSSKAQTRVQSPSQSMLQSPTSPNQRRRIMQSPNFQSSFKVGSLSPQNLPQKKVQFPSQSQYSDDELKRFNEIFLVMEFVDSDLKKVLKTV